MQVDPFSSLRHIWADRTVLVLSLVTFLSYLPEAGQSTCFFVYLTLVLGEHEMADSSCIQDPTFFDSVHPHSGVSKMNVAIFICYVGVVSAVCQTGLLSALIRRLGAKRSIMVCTNLPQSCNLVITRAGN